MLHLESRGRPTTQELLELQKALHIECLRQSSSAELLVHQSDYTPDDVKRLARYLSGPLVETENWESSGYRIRLLRVLVAALALLHHLGVEELHAEPYKELRQRIADRFRDIVYGRRQSRRTAAGLLQYIQALFLIRLAAQYFSLFKRRQPSAEALAIPVLGLVLTGASLVRSRSFSLSA